METSDYFQSEYYICLIIELKPNPKEDLEALILGL